MNLKLKKNSASFFTVDAFPLSIIDLVISNWNESIEVFQLNDANLNCIQKENGEGWNGDLIKKLDFYETEGKYETHFVIENGMNKVLFRNKGEECEIQCEVYVNPSIFNSPYENISTSGFL